MDVVINGIDDFCTALDLGSSGLKIEAIHHLLFFVYWIVPILRIALSSAVVRMLDTSWEDTC